jgi:hypothetical protein
MSPAAMTHAERKCGSVALIKPQLTTAASQLLFSFTTFSFFRTFLMTTRVLFFYGNANITISERTFLMGERLLPAVFFHETPRTDIELRNTDTAICLHSYTFTMHPKVSSSPVVILF